MNSLILLLLIVAAVAVNAAPLNHNALTNTYLVNNHYPAFINDPMRHHYGYHPYLLDRFDNGEVRQGSVPGITILAQQMAAALSNMQLYYTVQKWNLILCLLDSSCPEVVLPPVPPFETTTTTTAAPATSSTTASTTTEAPATTSTTTTTTTEAPAVQLKQYSYIHTLKLG